MSGVWMQSYSGRAVDLVNPKAKDIDMLHDGAEALARICRYGGHVPGGTLSVAQHCVVMGDCAFADTGDPLLALYMILHDAHEYLFGDMTTPQVDALMEIERELFPGNARGVRHAHVSCVVKEAKRRGDLAIWKACKLPEPTERQQRIIKHYDIRMLATEKLQLLAPPPKRWAAAVENAEPLRLHGRLTLWPVWKAADEYRDRLRRWCPAFAKEVQS